MAWYNFWKKKPEPEIKPQVLRPEDDPNLPTFLIKALGNDYYWMKVSWAKPKTDSEKIALIRNVSAMLTQLQTGQLSGGMTNILVSYDQECGTYISQVMTDNIVQFYELFKKGVLDNLQSEIEKHEKVIMMPWQTFNQSHVGDRDDD